MKYKKSFFPFVNTAILVLLSVVCLLPFINTIAISFSSNLAVNKGLVSIWPVEFTTRTYEFVLQRKEFWQALWVSCKRLSLGVPLNMLLTIMAAYPLSKSSKNFKARTKYSWYFFFTMLFGGGMIPLYFVVYQLKLIDSIWSLVLPGALPVFNLLILLNFFRQLPDALDEVAYIEGASHWRILWQIYVPLSKASLATLTLFSLVHHWNAWFDGIIYMNMPEHYPLQSFLRTVITMPDLNSLAFEDWKNLQDISDRTVKAAQIIVATLPILVSYPMLQKYYIKGMVLGAVKG